MASTQQKLDTSQTLVSLPKDKSLMNKLDEILEEPKTSFIKLSKEGWEKEPQSPSHTQISSSDPSEDQEVTPKPAPKEVSKNSRMSAIKRWRKQKAEQKQKLNNAFPDRLRMSTNNNSKVVNSVKPSLKTVKEMVIPFINDLSQEKKIKVQIKVLNRG